MEFEYKILEKSHYLFITLKGKITKESKDAFQSCHKEILDHSEKTIVLILKDIQSIDFAMARDFTLFQHEVRNKHKTMYLVGLKMQLKENLNSRGLLRTHELRNSIEDVISANAA